VSVAPLLDELRHVDGVRSVEQAGQGVTVHGDRRIIAHVGAILVRRGSVPDDLSVRVPNLEDALLGLLDGEPDADATVPVPVELIGRRQ